MKTSCEILLLLILLKSSCFGQSTDLTHKNNAAPSSESFTQHSDQRLKRNVKPLSRSLSKVRILKPVNYQWNSVLPHDTVSLQTGFIAQDLEVVFPDLVQSGKEGFKSVNYLGLIPHLVQAIKELKVENDQLKVENAQLKKSTTRKEKDLEARIRKLETLVAQMNTRLSEK